MHRLTQATWLLAILTLVTLVPLASAEDDLRKIGRDKGRTAYMEAMRKQHDDKYSGDKKKKDSGDSKKSSSSSSKKKDSDKSDRSDKSNRSRNDSRDCDDEDRYNHYSRSRGYGGDYYTPYTGSSHYRSYDYDNDHWYHDRRYRSSGGYIGLGVPLFGTTRVIRETSPAVVPPPAYDNGGGWSSGGSRGYSAGQVPHSGTPSTVRAVQTRLRQLGYYSGSLDGIYGNGTYDAIRRIQSDYGLPAHGRIDPALLSLLGIG